MLVARTKFGKHLRLKAMPCRYHKKGVPLSTASRRDAMLVAQITQPAFTSRRDAISVAMANTYTQIHIQTVFTVQNRICLIRNHWKEELYRFVTAIVQNHGHKVLAINGMPDHVHLFFGMRPTQSLSRLMQIVKCESSKWINDKQIVRGHFSWQEGYGAFSYSKSHVSEVVQYIRNQEQHHRRRTFIEEYHELLKKFGLAFEDQFSFTPIEYKNDGEQ